jgi:hypothetical protein
MEGAHSVVLDSELRYEVTSDRSATVRLNRKVLLLDHHHEHERHLAQAFDDDTRIVTFEAASFDNRGNEIFSARKSNFTDRKYLSEVNFYDDLRIKQVEVPCPSYPCTVSYTIERKLKDFGAMSFPHWLPLGREQGLQRASFTAIVPLDNELLYDGHQLPEPTISEDGKQRSYQWNLSNIPPQADEPFAPVIRQTLPYLRIGLDRFQIDDYTGSFRDWRAFGSFIYRLTEGRQELPPRLVMEVRELVAGAESEEEKVDRLYRFLQRKARYVSVQLGIGGWQPFSAGYVEQNAYGDCKALSNYMGAILQEAGIESYPVLINAADKVYVPLREDFATSAFNHMILYVPSTQTYLECTNKHSPTGYLGESTQDRTVLWVTPEGGKLARTPAPRPADNGHVRTIRLTVDESGVVDFDMEATFFGATQEMYRAVGVHLADRQDQLDWLHQHDFLPDVSGEHYAYEVSDRQPRAHIEYRTSLRNQVRKMGSRRFLTVNPYPVQLTPEAVADRQLPVETQQARQFVDTVHLTLPDNWEVESGLASEPYVVEHPAGSYRAEIRPVEHGYLYTRTLRLRPVRLPREEYAGLRQFYLDVSQADRAQLVLNEKRTK